MNKSDKNRPIEYGVTLTLSRIPFIIKEAFIEFLKPSRLLFIIGVITISQIFCFGLAYVSLMMK